MASNTISQKKQTQTKQKISYQRGLLGRLQKGFVVCSLFFVFLLTGGVLGGMLGGIFGGVLVIGEASAQDAAQDADAVVKFRKSLMQETKASLQAMSLLLKGKISDKESLALQAQILALASQRAGEAFVFRTRGLTESTTAHERVWTEQAKFRAKMDIFAKDTKAFSELATSAASAKKMGVAFGKLAKQCKSCHKRYRVEDK